MSKGREDFPSHVREGLGGSGCSGLQPTVLFAVRPSFLLGSVFFSNSLCMWFQVQPKVELSVSTLLSQ